MVREPIGDGATLVSVPVRGHDRVSHDLIGDRAHQLGREALRGDLVRCRSDDLGDLGDGRCLGRLRLLLIAAPLLLRRALCLLWPMATIKGVMPVTSSA